MGVTYTAALEISAAVAVVGVFLWAYACAPGERRERLVKAIGETSVVFGVLVTGVVYLETPLLSGEILPGVHLWRRLLGGGGYPWGAEQVAYNTCFIPSAVRGDCEFLNYNELLLIGLVCVLVGFILWNRSPEEPANPREKKESFTLFSVLWNVAFMNQIWWPNRDAKSRFQEYTKCTEYQDATRTRVGGDPRRE